MFRISAYLAVFVIFISTFFLYQAKVLADPSNTSVTVTNEAPSISGNVAENPASDDTTPTNEGAQVTFQGTATDPNTDNYFLAICKTNSITPGGPGAPTCGGGNWCISNSTASGAQASCNYTALNADAESNDWFAFACDANTGQLCSAMNQGTGSSGSPFAVNHVPSFTNITDGSADPGGTITFSSTASDTDISGPDDQVKLFVCASAGATSAGCTGTTLCSAALAASDPSCQYNLPSVIEDGNYNYYAYIYDSHDLAASNNPFPAVSYTVNNVAPVVSNVTLNAGTDISLTENTTTAIVMTSTVSDNNSCQDLSTVVSSIYRSTVTYSGCDAGGENNNNYCYANVSCSVSGGSCSGNTDGAANYTCTANVQYHADPTDVDTQFDADTWLNTFLATDNGTNTHSLEVTTGVEMESLVALNVTSTINYGPLAQNTNSSSPETTTVTATGNVGLDTELSGTNMTSGGNTIAVGQQEYDVASFSYGNGTDLTALAVLLGLDVNKTTVSGSPETKLLYWEIGIPAAQPSGSYTGTNTVTAIKSNILNW